MICARIPSRRCITATRATTATARAMVYACEPPSYQITVYDPAGEGPAWMREATMMQIMVDRFHGAGEKDHTNLAPWCLLP